MSPQDYRKLFRRCGFDIHGQQGIEISGVLGPKELGEGSHGNFYVNLDEGWVKDWGSSGYKGDVFSVVKDTQSLDFTESIQWIVDELNLDASQLGPDSSNGSAAEPAETNSNAPSSSRLDSFRKPVVSEDQIDRWHTRLMSEASEAQTARTYLTESRGIAEEVLRAARIGLAYSPDDHRAKWWIMIPVPERRGGDPPRITALKGFAFDPDAGDWKRKDGRKIPRNSGSAALYDLVPSNPPDGPVIVCEGELDALSALSNGFNAVTGTSGARTFKEEWAQYIAGLKPTRSFGVVVAFDGDEAGQKGARDAARMLSSAEAKTRIASLPSGQDVNDVLVRDGPDVLDSLISEATPYPEANVNEKAGVRAASDNPTDSSEPELEYDPFPLQALPGPVRAYVRASARALGEEIPPAMVTVPTLSVLSGAIGDAARLKLKRSWTEPATLWTVLVAPSGSTKSPAFFHATRPVFRRESKARDEHEEALAEWKAQEEPDPQDRPVRRRFRTGDATPEAVVQILDENPRGVLLARDELGAWLGSFDRYVNGAADLQFWVEVWQGTQASRDRAGDGNTTIDAPVVPVTGTIQPGSLQEKLGEIHFDTGFAARLVLCQPPLGPKRWTEADVSQEVRDNYEQLLSRLYSTPRGEELSLTSGAKEKWVSYYNEANASLETRPEGPAKAVAAKGITHSARLALILHLCRRKTGETSSKKVDKESMTAALRVGKWLTNETFRVYQELDLDEEALPPKLRLLKLLPDKFRTKEAKEVAEEEGIPERTCQKWLGDLRDDSKLEKIRRGLYSKI
ncbi:DUF3987 domain-containing protein [Salinibacter sp.]|uniref:DUF3987 domain-containing protein n=1 Tax=Salinibacter sp. TaxID=2065818 RepID=UPI0021E70CC4|nr:DUF3987 domain-containing protein [Salinibacter sp.]